MHLSVTCPRCESKYQLDPSMRGKKMRCPNAICRAVFEVRDDNDPPAEAKAPEPLPEAKPAEAPPIVAKPAPAPPIPVAKPAPAPPVPVAKAVEPPKPEAPMPTEAKRKPVPKPVAPAPGFPDDFPGDEEAAPAAEAPTIATEAWQPEAREAPPVREAVAPVAPPRAEPQPRRRSRALWVIGGMMLALVLVAGVAYWRIRGGIESNEAERWQKAETLYNDQDFAAASAALQKLHRDFPDSSNNKKYRFLAELSDVRGVAYGARETPEEIRQSVERVLQLAGVYKGDPLLKEREADLGQTLDFLAHQLTKLAEQEKSPALLPAAQRAWAEAKKFGVAAGKRESELESEWTRVERVLAAHAERERVIAVIRKHLESATAAGVQEAWSLAEKTRRQDDPEIRGFLSELQKAHREQVRFVPANAEEKPRALDEDALVSVAVAPSLRADRALKLSGPPLLALARGVLHAFDPAKGELRWARRVGIDTHALPLRVPADAITPELVLALSSDQRSLAGLVADTGEPLWQTALDGPCVGTPVLIERTVLVPTLTGRIDEIEIAEGRRLGAYHLGQPLPLGGVRLPGTPLVYFPADEYCLYEIDVTKRLCTNILYTRHAPGSLRGVPAIALGEKESTLLWAEATGLERAVVKPYTLPIQKADQTPVEPIVELKGLTAPLWVGADRWAALTAGGFLSPWGVRQKGTRDPLFYPLRKHEFPVDALQRPGRCEIVHADAENYWTLVGGRLQRVQATFDVRKGPELIASWTQPVAVGTLLHAAQTRQEADGRLILFLATQASEQPVCSLSAIDAESGKILWQRQLGALPQLAPLAVKDQLLLPDAHGVLRFDIRQLADKADTGWRHVGDWLTRQPLAEASVHLLIRNDTYVQLAASGNKLRLETGLLAGDQEKRAFDVTLPAALQGTPALGDGFVLVPLANGILVRVQTSDGSLINGPDWRAAGAEEQAAGHIVFVNDKDILITDGSRGIARIASADGKTWDKRATHAFAHRVVAPPVMMPASGQAKVCVLDASDTVTLLDAERLTVLRRVSLEGKVTAGPFVRGGKIGCVVGRNQLVWLDPDQKEEEKKIAWTYAFDADIVGEPQLIDGMLVVADVAGQFLALDPASGRPLGARFTLKANVAPTAAPVPLGPGRAFVALTDGTIVILPLDRLRGE